MKPYYSDALVTLEQGDVLDVLRDLPSESVHCCVTSPPYWGLRDYGAEGQIGLEPTPEEYVAKLVKVFREVRRVLRSDGTLWLNLGDSYAGSWKNQGRKDERGSQRPINGPMIQSFNGHPSPVSNAGVVPVGLKPKDLVGIPWRVAFALRDDGWWLRSDIIWSKPSPMPESVRDRPTKSHEYIFLLSKAASYYYDADAIAEPSIREGAHVKSNGAAGMEHHGDGITRAGLARGITIGATRNKRTVWTIATKPYPEAHFATFPPELPELCIKAGTSEAGCCARCGAPYTRVVKREAMEIRPSPSRAQTDAQGLRTQTRGTMTKPPSSVTTGWEPGCACEADSDDCVVLDLFAGAGTTSYVAKKLGRKSIAIELNEEYCGLIVKRCQTVNAVQLTLAGKDLSA